MSTGLKRYHHSGLLHFITFSCVRHRPILATEVARDTFCELLESTRGLYAMEVHAYVVMPDHVHLILSEPEEKPLSVAIQILKQRFSKTRPEEYVWESRYYDFNIRTPEKRIEKLKYIHRNPVRRGLVERQENWQWSSFRDYADLARGPVKITFPTW